MTQILPRFSKAMTAIADAEKIGRILRETGEAEEKTSAGATKAGDPRRLRGVPITARGVPGVSPGTSPLPAILRSERR